MGKRPSNLGAWFAAGLSVAGLAGFILLFARRMDIWGWILAPVIFAVYQIPAALLYGLWKRRRAEALPKPDEAPGPSTEDHPAPPANPA